MRSFQKLSLVVHVYTRLGKNLYKTANNQKWMLVWRSRCDEDQSWVSLFVAGAVFGEIWVDSRSAKCCNFQYKMRCRGGKSKLCERTGSVLQFHGRIMFGSWSNRPRIGNDASTVFGKFFLDFGVQFCVAGAVFGEVGGWCLLLRAL